MAAAYSNDLRRKLPAVLPAADVDYINFENVLPAVLPELSPMLARWQLPKLKEFDESIRLPCEKRGN